MSRLGRKYQGVFRAWTWFGTTNGVHVVVEVVERSVWQPSFVEVEGIDIVAEHRFDGLNVVKDTVVSRLSNGQYARFFISRIACKWVLFDLAANGLRVKFTLRNRADDAVVVACRHQEYRNRTTHDDRVENRFVTVTVHNHDIARRNGRVPNNLVGC